MSYRRILWTDTYPDRGGVRIVAGTAKVVKCRDDTFLIAKEPGGKNILTFASPTGGIVSERQSVVLRRTNGRHGDTAGHWQRIADSINETKLPNVRFWTHGNEGPVRLTLEPGQSLSIHYGGPTDEGSYDDHTLFTYDPHHECGCPAVVCERTRDESDCDGRHEWRCDTYCPVGSLDAVPYDDNGRSIGMPDWQHKHASQRDHFAELMNY